VGTFLTRVFSLRSHLGYAVNFRMERLLVLNGVDSAAELTRLPQVKIIEP
jgi:hypothetical protein